MASDNTVAGTVIEMRPTAVDGAENGVAMETGAGRPSGAAGAIWDALTASPGLTVAEITVGAQVSRATVAQVLTAMERDGRAVRMRGGRDGAKRLPDVWRAVTSNTTTGPGTDAATDCATDSGGGEEARSGAAAPAQPATGVATGTVTEPGAVSGTDAPDGGEAEGHAGGMDPAAVAEARGALASLAAAIAEGIRALDAGDGAAALTAVEAAYSGSGWARRSVRAAVRGRPRTASGRPRSPRGELRSMVEAHLAAHPGAAFTPHEVGRVLGRSAGAVSNALDRLVELGRAELVCERPRRFTTPTR